MTRHRVILLAGFCALLSGGCRQAVEGRLEVLDAQRAYGRTVAVLPDLHGDGAVSRNLDADLRAALAARGFVVVADPGTAQTVILPTLGRMTSEKPGEGTAGPADLPPARRRGAGAGGFVVRRSGERTAAAAPRPWVGLLLTGVEGGDFRRFGVHHQALPPLWRIYAAKPASGASWKDSVRPVVEAAADAAAPLAKPLSP